MGIVMTVDKDRRSVPVLVCDQCGLRIETQGRAVWEPNIGLVPIYYLHTACLKRFIKESKSDKLWSIEDLDVTMCNIVFNSKLNCNQCDERLFWVT